MLSLVRSTFVQVCHPVEVARPSKFRILNLIIFSLIANIIELVTDFELIAPKSVLHHCGNRIMLFTIIKSDLFSKVSLWPV